MNEQISIFELLDGETLLPQERQKFRRALRVGSGFKGGKERIKQKASTLNKKDFALFLKKEYGIGGCSFENGFVSTTSMWFYVTDNGWQNRKEYSWTEVATEILDMIRTNTY